MNMKNAMKTVVALGSGAVMLGATIGGALAADLGDFPAPFIKDGGMVGKIVVGEKADSADLLGAIDIAASMQRLSKVPMTISSTGVSVSDGDTQEVALGGTLTSTGGLDSNYRNDQLSVLQDTSVDINGTSINTHDEINLDGASGLKLVTSLTKGYEDYATDVFTEVNAGDLEYCYVFDEDINLSTEVSSDQPLEIEFLGQNLKINSIDADNKLTAVAGKEVYLNAGDSTVVEGKKITLDRCGADSIVVTVDGQPATINGGQTKTVNGIKIKADQIFNDDGIQYDSATLIIGADTTKSYADGNAWIGQDTSNPDWTWKLSGLTATTGQVLCVQNEFVYDNDETAAKKVGEYYSFPNEFVDVGVASLTVPDDKYMGLTFDYKSSVNLKNANTGYTSKKAIEVYSATDDSIVLNSTALTVLSADKKVKDIYLVVGANAEIEVFYKDPDDSNLIKAAGNVSQDVATNVFANINYGKTKGTDVSLELYGNSSATDAVYLGIVPATPSNDAIWAQLKVTGDTEVLGFGATARSEEAAELRYGNSVTPTSGDTIGTQEKDQRGAYGIWVEKPKTGGAADKYVFHIPSDQVKANTVIKSGKAAVGGGSSGTYDKVNPIPVGMGILDKDANLGGSTPYIVVGGPCANTVAYQLLATPSVDKCADGFTEGTAKIKWFGDKNALLVAGYSAQDTVGASRVVSNFGDYPTGFAIGKTEFEVVTSSLTNIQVK
jgi:hypothetical protein